MSLETMLETQKKLQAEFDARATDTDPQRSCEYIKDMCLAGVAELMELLEETGWKPWSISWHINHQQAMAEWIDAWHFMLNIANKLGMSAQSIEERYAEKAEINLARIRGGYDGVSTKCPQCKRALDDPATTCIVTKVPELDDLLGGVCSQYGAWHRG